MANQLKKIDHTAARHAEVKRRYAWQAQQRRKQNGEKPNQARLLTLIRLRELERIFQNRYGRFLPDDDAGLDDLTLAAHHIAHLRGEVIKHIVAWAHAWAPWLPQDKAEQLAERVAAEPGRFTADALAWRLRLSMAERTALKVTTIGAFDMSKAERLEERKRKRREAERARRAKNSSGRPRGRPRKMRGQQVDRILVATDFRRDADAAREVPEHGSGVDTSKNQINTSDAAQSQLSGLGKGQSAVPPSTTTRAVSPQMPELTKPPADIVDEAVHIAREHPSPRLPTDRSSVQRMLERLWPSHVKSRIAFANRYYGTFDPEKDLRAWHSSFRTALDDEASAIERYRERRRKWQQKQATPVYTRRTGSIFETDAWKRVREQDEARERRKELLERLQAISDRNREATPARPSRIVWPAPGFVVPPEELPL